MRYPLQPADQGASALRPCAPQPHAPAPRADIEER
ncbi:hypothetical protein BLA15945_06843 [Burkholderia lata]|uniref:Uncharacterized protein n=1 Tax=Burkholderia lata (strain ATCC 17760 / DSM 23089 / LMG 22485 / NCIMB 9086 / R18194 / 383) TaxID=482957 RepID=A0A6P2RLJ2_BURL3|nr:hypothetical protein BLA15945_06843 [Burkholderia lata]